MTPARVWVIIPALDEAESLPRVLADLPRAQLHDVLVVDNGSTDDTAGAARQGGARVVCEPRRGYGQACLTGIANLVAAGARADDVVVFLDADHSDRPEELPRVAQLVVDGRADLVIGSRTLGRAERGALTWPQRVGNALATTLIRLLYRQRCTDLGPFRAIRFGALRALRMRDTSYGWTVEMQVRAARAGLRVIEVPVSYRPRHAGRSKVSGSLRGSLLAGWFILSTIAKHVIAPTAAAHRPRGDGDATVSIVIPTLNEAGTIGALLARIAAMTPPPAGVLICDGGSTDATLDRVRAASVTARVVPCHPGRGVQCNTGAQHTRSEIVWFLHADSAPPRDGIAVIRRAMRRAPLSPGGAFRFAIADPARGYRRIEAAVQLRTALAGMPFGDQGFFVRRESLVAVGGFPDVPILEDRDLWWRLRRRGRFIELPTRLPTSARRWRTLGIARATLLNWWILSLDAAGFPRDRLAAMYAAATPARPTTASRPEPAPPPTKP
ncbi:MAG: TIGR04283 family arsenosugar biosynthesis glycosyltransferase [Planctomycetota bacterium]